MSLYDQLDDSLAECPISRNKFLPLNILQNLITEDNVRANIGSDVEGQTSSDNDGLAKDVVRLAKKVFACLIFVGCQNAIGDLLSEGLTDEKLPLFRSGSGSDRNVLSARIDGTTFKTFRDWKRPDVDHFLEKQWRVQAPVFDTKVTGGHFSLNRHCALPLQSKTEEIGSTQLSTVVKCTLYPGHYRPASKVIGQFQVAIKLLRNYKDFERERLNLTTIQNLNNRHLIKHIATCESDSQYYVIFPLANGGSLLDYWARKNEIPRDQGLIFWSLQQMLGLAGAICALHHDLDGEIHCRHGDLKPANVLLFNEDESEDGLLVIADLGVSRVYEHPTHIRRSGTTTKATTRSYQAPEVELELYGQPRARTYDIWSLGCVFLEFAIWLLYDFHAIQNFEENRRRPVGNPQASFYQMTPERKAKIPPEVSDAIKALREDQRCKGGTAVESLVNLIADKLLVTVVEDRYKAEQLRDELQKIVQDAEQNPSYLLNVTGQRSPIPKIFLPAEQPPKTW
ncbi:kinase-like domain-containing protein [Amylocarpus encephaloides]|uniref:Kinase-like domain-containing protein n=1 Tax=Amylocarpus encephaloides TaxID=45428 RepID=A0A9P7YKP8_9HELO|nr:kinase-like domain-containing protein [Amylocarpus encephaloides]